MILVMTLLVRNESDILSANLDYHLSQGIDHIIVTDNRSSDGTLDILSEYQKNRNVTVLFEDSDNYSQGQWVTRMAQMAIHEFQADWVINSDADEFWWPKVGTLKESIQDVSSDIGALYINRTNFLPSNNDNIEFYHRMIIRENISLNIHGNPLPPKVCHRGFEDVEIHVGNHDITTSHKHSRMQFENVEILHYPLRVYKQFEMKIKFGGSALERNTELPTEIGSTWRKLYKEYMAGKLEQYYNTQIPDDTILSKGLADGSLVEDTRLSHYMQNLKDKMNLASY